jgi:hypothetical protein
MYSLMERERPLVARLVEDVDRAHLDGREAERIEPEAGARALGCTYILPSETDP